MSDTKSTYIYPATRYYLREWYKWATVPRRVWWRLWLFPVTAPNNYPFSRRMGLCGNVLNLIGPGADINTIHKDFNRAFGDEPYPFGQSEYMDARRNHNQHKDPKRLAWVKDVLNDQ